MRPKFTNLFSVFPGTTLYVSPLFCCLLAQQLHKLRSAALQWLSSHYPSMSFSEAEDLVSEGVANYLRTPLCRNDSSWHWFHALIRFKADSKHGKQICAPLGTRHLERRHRSRAFWSFSTETSEEIGVCIESAETLLNEVTKLTDDSGDALWKDQCIELVNRCIGELQDPCMTILRCFYYHNLSMTEIAEEVGLKNADTAKAKKNQCMKRLIDNVKSLVKFWHSSKALFLIKSSDNNMPAQSSTAHTNLVSFSQDWPGGYWAQWGQCPTTSYDGSILSLWQVSTRPTFATRGDTIL